MPRREGIPCSSAPCSVADTSAGSTTSSKSSSLRNFMNFDKMEVDTDIDTRPARFHFTKTKTPSRQPAPPHVFPRPKVPTSYSPAPQTHIMNAARTGLPIWNHSVAKRMADGNSDQRHNDNEIPIVPRRPYPVDPEAARISSRKQRALLRKLKRMSWTRKVRVVACKPES
ncbi:uncharacterized protein EKO05_0010468 [Ascochyta rabiei]|uniref:Uncharacterized protein n=1 Tax=Didymella rabiei TaxID=5454 RepID=A0A163KZ86_DIDRA|nr:uncharacterized protein EKO05_0010468 [Ascochyta rabiei]KZM27368.1 hypothetical protein ST47_g1487 [Ascochyta rabiei]UPX20228.1 hypothetical protein EKO05_0010468 [Ascochyta rabiei]